MINKEVALQLNSLHYISCRFLAFNKDLGERG